MIYGRLLSMTLFALYFALPLEAATATWDPNPEPDVTGYLLSYGTQPGIHDTVLDVGNVVTYQFFPPAGRRYYVVIQAYDSRRGLSPKSDEVFFDVPATQEPPQVWTPSASQPSTGTPPLLPSTPPPAPSTDTLLPWQATNTNRPPVLAPPMNQSHVADNQVSLQLWASDPDGTAVTYLAANLPPGLTLDASTGLISGTLTVGSVGLHTVIVTASDGALSASQTFAWSVDRQDAPIWGDFDGDGYYDPATYRASTGEWRIWPSSSGFVEISPVAWGASGDIPVPADYDGDRRTDFAVYRPSTGVWYVLLSSTNMQTNLQIQWGDANDQPLPIDYDQDGRADLVLPRFGVFEILLSGSNYTYSVTVR